MLYNKKTPEHQAAYETLRNMILLGRFAPGQPLTIQGLADALNGGMTPAREAIRRLVSENALETLGNRRVALPLLNQRALEDIYMLRLEIEPKLASRAVKNISQQIIDRLLVIDDAVNMAIAIGDVGAYLERNYAFHFGIYELADSPVLLRMAQMLWLQVGPSLRVICGRFGTANLPDKHPDILSALLEGKPENAAVAMRDDLTQGIELINQSFFQKFDQKLGVSG